MSRAYDIIDAHAHVASSKFIPRSFMEGVVDNITVQLESRGVKTNPRVVMDLYAAKLQDHDSDELVREMDEAGFSQTVLLLPDYTYALREFSLTIQEMFDSHRAILERHPGRFFVFAGVDPRWGRDGVDLFERGLRDYGFHGMKLYTPCGYSPADPALYPFYELCREYCVPVLTHIGATSPVLRFDTAVPMLIDQPARDFRGVDFILAHGSIHHVDECAMLCSHRPNVFLDVSGFAGGRAGSTRHVLSLGINHKIIFGTDWPVFRAQGTQKAIFDRLLAEAATFPDSFAKDGASFFSGTIQRLLAKHRVTAQAVRPSQK